MINTLEIKQEQFVHGTFRLGTGEETILIVGSCRSVPYLTYLGEWNAQNGNRFSIHFLDPFNWNWNMKEERVDYNAELIKQEGNQTLLDTLSKTSIFIHEYYANAEMFNCDKNAEKNIYQFGLNPKIDICTPNFNDVFILTSDILRFHPEVMKMAVQDYNVNGQLSTQTLDAVSVIRNRNMERFLDICSKTDTPELAEIFMNNYKSQRLFYTFNHISKDFAQIIFRLMNDKFLHLDMSNYTLSDVDLYANPRTYLTEYDLGYTWDEPVKKLKEIL